MTTTKTAAAKKTTKTTAKAAKTKPAATKTKPTTVTGRMVDTLKALKHGKTVTHDAVAKVTGRAKGNLLRELTAMGYVKTAEGGETARGNLFTITANGVKALTKAAEAAKAAAKAK